MSDLFRSKGLATAAFVVMLVLNGLAGTTILGGNTTADVSDAFPNLFAPAGVTFAIWGLIYLGLAAYVVRQFTTLGSTDRSKDALIKEITPLFLVTSVLNATWIVAWQYRLISLSAVLIIGILVTLIALTARLCTKQYSLVDYLAIRLPFSIYFGWLTVATIANITVWLVSVNWGGFGISPEAWTSLILVVGALIGMTTAIMRSDWAYLAVFVWAYAGIWLKHTSTTGFSGDYPAVITTALALLAVLAGITLYLAARWPTGQATKS